MKILFLFFFIPFCTLAFAQREGVVVNEKKEPLAYANIWNTDASAGATSDEKGYFVVEKALPEDVFVVHAAGYQTQTVPAPTADTIIMQPQAQEPKGLLVLPEKTLHHTVGDAHYENLYFNPGNLPWIYARFFASTPEIKQLPYLDKAIVYTRSLLNQATFRLRIYRPDHNGCPGEDLLLEPLIVTVKRGNKKNLIELLDYNIKMPKEGVFIAVEWLLTANNQMKTQTYIKNDLAFESYRYAPDLISNRVAKSTAYRYMYGEWISNDQFLKEEERKGDLPFIDPSIGLILSN